jgi:hypothetical protein
METTIVLGRENAATLKLHTCETVSNQLKKKALCSQDLSNHRNSGKNQWTFTRLTAARIIYPILLVDRVLEVERKAHQSVEKTCRSTNRYAGHFRNIPSYQVC